MEKEKERVHESFAQLMESQTAFYNDPSGEALAAVLKNLHTVQVAMRELPKKEE